jgi:hypothetical protein
MVMMGVRQLRGEAPTGLVPVDAKISASHDPASWRGKRKVHHALAWSWGRHTRTPQLSHYL